MLTDAKCRNAPAQLRQKASAVFLIRAALYLQVSPAGSKRWFWKMYR
jgi:hypothetical protein